MISARVFDDPYGFSLGVIFTNEGEGMPREVARYENGRFAGWDTPSPGAPFEPNLVLDGEFARALLDALTRHYHGAEDSRALRKDYDAERGRVDRLTEHLAEIARNITAPVSSPFAPTHIPRPVT